MLKPHQAVLGLAILLALIGISWGQPRSNAPPKNQLPFANPFVQQPTPSNPQPKNQTPIARQPTPSNPQPKNQTPIAQQPTPSNPQPENQTPTAQQPDASDQSGGERSPTFAKIIPTPKTDAEAAEEAEDRAEKALTDMWIIRWTGSVAFFTLVLAGVGAWQGIQLKRSVDLARNEFVSTHRPKIRIKHVWLISNDIWHDTPIVVRVVCVNHGITEAVISDYGIQYFVVKEGQSLPPDSKIQKISVSGFKLPSGVSLPLPDFSSGTTITSDQYFDIRSYKAKLYCMGVIHYLDGLHHLRTTAFCRFLTIEPGQKIGRFSVPQDSEYEYAD
jgi:hypothetical protein